MNTELLQELKRKIEHARDFVESRSMRQELRMILHWDKEPQQFAMRFAFSEYDCGTAGCLLGYGLGMTGGVRKADQDYHAMDSFSMFAERFDLDRDIVLHLCHPRGTGYFPYRLPLYADIKAKDAAQALQHVLDGATEVEDIWKHVIARHNASLPAERHHLNE